MKIPFDIKYRPQIESVEYKVVTRDGRPVRIIYWDARGDFPIVALIGDGPEDGPEDATQHKKNGRYFTDDCDLHPADLFIITPEQGFTEFEEEVDSVIRSYHCEEFEGDYSAWVKARSAKLLALAREEIDEFDLSAV